MSDTQFDIIEIDLSAAGPSGLGGGVAPYGIYAVDVDKHESKKISDGKNKGLVGTTVWTAIAEGTEPDAVGMPLRPYLVWPDASVEEGGKKDAMTAKIKRFLVAVNDGDEEKQTKIKAHKGKLKFNAARDLAQGKRFYVLWDPADRNAGENDEYAFLTKDEYEAGLAGELKVKRKNTYGLTAAQAEALGLSKEQGSGTRAAAAGAAGGAIPDTAWTPPTAGASSNGKAPAKTAAGKKAAAPPPAEDDADMFA